MVNHSRRSFNQRNQNKAFTRWATRSLPQDEMSRIRHRTDLRNDSPTGGITLLLEAREYVAWPVKKELTL